ncbi:hypothetical protein [Streptococcus suis]|uniref:hypothetical protein n=1 Tax=Streptococcus suis TaxID=1307 RepID=UPI001C94FAA4|nr:hypothetical protein [Streptococcus suis]MBY4959444.1 hypothetical protein [Streptococcus suis]
MLFTIDRLQIIDDRLIAFEFFNVDVEKSNELFIKRKISEIQKFVGNGIDEFYYIRHSGDYSSFEVSKNGEKPKQLNFEVFSTWFLDLNGSASSGEQSSKELGSVRNDNIDNFVSSILNEIYQEEFDGIDFSVDDNGLGLVKQVLGQAKKPTFGFDADIFSSNYGIIIEFLKRQNIHVTNLTAHPARYTKNKNKFISLWKAAEKLYIKRHRLGLINYSDSAEEEIGLIAVREFDTDIQNAKMNLDELAFVLTDRDDLVRFLVTLDSDIDKGNQYLENKALEIRNRDFFEEVYDEQHFASYNKWNCKKIGENYSKKKR